MDDRQTGELLSSTRIGKHCGLSNVRVNLILAELGWIEKYANGWAPTPHGTALGANVKSGSKAPFILWPESILSNPALLASVAEQGGAGRPTPVASRNGGAADKVDDPSAVFR